MKYEAKNVGGVATSQAAGTLWVGITQANARTAAVGACTGCHLITGAEWMTIAANVLSVSSNWSAGTTGSGFIYSGHSDNSPSGALGASASDNDGYSSTGNTAPSNQRRTLTLTSGETIWDLAGNVQEWTDVAITGAKPSSGTTGYEWRQYGAITNWGNLPASNQPSAIGAGNYTSAHGVGQIYSSGSETGARALLRGGFWDGRATTGVLSLNLSASPMGSGTMFGFRAAK